MHRILVSLIFAFSFIDSFSQKNPAKTTPIPLNKHYFEIGAEDSADHVYNKLVSYSQDSTKLERIFALNNKVSRIIRTSPKKEDFHEMIIEQYDSYGNLLWKETINQANTKFLRTYFFDGQQVAQVLHNGNRQYSIQRSGDAEPRELWYDDFFPKNVRVKKGEGLFSGLGFSLEGNEWPEKQTLIYYGIYVNEKGEAETVEWVNPMSSEAKFAIPYLKTLEQWADKFDPAKDAFGNPVGQWLYLHFHIGGPRRVDKIIFN
ncbi:hypothetical protein [Algoriphagus sp. A40]|uniref:hypothetical protein n=1 Tax=Algoriphagus sp. A40 TaxID=1945863 RepID=UPI000984A39F|nr:hypothetical protein [Algoriphagus sp. A40]OOG77841.1 hypothetical protein B0E43_03500 [Algoriphagus sp. A40]